MTITTINYKFGEKPEYTPSKLYLTLAALLDEALIKFPNFVSSSLITLQSEDDITEQLSVFLDDVTRSNSNPYGIFRFTNQSKTPSSRQKTDIGVRLASKSPSNVICFIEAKRIPTPTGKNRKHTEYVANDGRGGIERFKKEFHGKNLPCSIIIGYLQSRERDFWLRYYNYVIHFLSKGDKSWTYLDKMVHINEFIDPKVSKYFSRHTRIKEKEILLYHYWIYL